MVIVRTAVVTVIAIALVACSGYSAQDGRRGVSSSLVDYLYPDGEIPPEVEDVIPELRLPLTVGLAFVPSGLGMPQPLSEAKKAELLEEVRERFIHLDYVKEITIIPETYMRSAKGFTGVGQVARLYGLDIVALVSYDQVSVTAETKSSVLYWTIVGAYFVKGNENTATTFVDTAVFDVASNKLLFRAPGVSEVEQSSTLIEINASRRETGVQGFEMAMADMSENLVNELDSFKEKIEEDQSIQVTNRPGYGGGGAMHWSLLLMLSGVAALKFYREVR